MSRVTLDQMKQAVTGAADNAKLRLGSDGQLKTAKHGFFGRAVRWMFGATKQDRADNKKIMGDLLAGLQQKYGREVGTRAFLAARPETYYSKGGHVMAECNKPLKAHQVQRAIAEAKASPLRYAPGGDKFNRVEARANIGANQLSPEQSRYFKSRLMEHVGLKAQQGKPLDADGIEKFASKLLEHTVNNVGDDATVRQKAYDNAKKTTLQTISALSGGNSERVPGLLLELARNCEAVVLDALRGQGKDLQQIGVEDKENAKQQVIQRAVSRLTSKQAKQLYDSAMSSSGTGRQLLLAIRVADAKLDMDADYDMMSHGDLLRTTQQLFLALGARAGIPRDGILDTMDSIYNSRTSGKEQHGVPKDALSDAGVKDARKVGSLLTGFQAAVKGRSGDFERNAREVSNFKATEKYWASDPSVGLTDGFIQLATDLNLDPSKLTDLQRQEYNTRLRENVVARSQLHSKELSKQQIAEIAKESMKQVLKLSKAGVLDQAIQARAAYTKAVKALVTGLAGDQDAATLLGLLKNVNERLKEHAAAEMIDDLGGGELGDLTDLAMLRAGIPKDDLSLARRNALRDDAPLRAISAAAQNVTSTDGFNIGAEDRLEMVGRVFSLANFVINGLATHVGTDVETDLNRLADGEVSKTALNQAQQALNPLLPPYRSEQI